MSQSTLRVVLLFALLQPSLAYFLFQSKYEFVQPVIETCRANYTNERTMCDQMQRCIFDNVFSEYPVRWSAGASILAFIPTIVGLMSNSIDEITAIADESILLAITISLSSVTVFSSRLGDSTTALKPSSQHLHAVNLQTARDNIVELLKQNKPKHSESLWNRWGNTRTQDAVIGLIMIGASTQIWYQLFQVTRYGIVTFACPVKVNVFLWAALGQFLTLLNVRLRHLSFNYRRIHFSANSRAQQTASRPTGNLANVESQIADTTIVLRCQRSGRGRRTLQFCTAVTSFSIYTYGTTVLASMTLFEAADALRVVVVVAVNAGFGRMVGYWAISSIRKGKKTILVDVPAAHIDDISRIMNDGF
ncbi:uncharacterized protein KY384_008538 [Bacidia gigantensis]|uniref:uncharacterized protein n=1 Tax=Bacidia gigantensis TaxID=2732470 RepID=UPI001D049160|nr:uncharacterized protein KY384_008538 [Bacidia gigantensis]KAG8527109.1 hypothetical protein KY384_008538 [Bacidia gigantensis]